MLTEERKAELIAKDDELVQAGKARSQWWKSLAPEEREFLIEKHQELLDDEGGVPTF